MHSFSLVFQVGFHHETLDWKGTSQMPEPDQKKTYCTMSIRRIQCFAVTKLTLIQGPQKNRAFYVLRDALSKDLVWAMLHAQIHNPTTATLKPNNLNTYTLSPEPENLTLKPQTLHPKSPAFVPPQGSTLHRARVPVFRQGSVFLGS